MTTKQKALSLAKELGVELEAGGSGQSFEVICTAPAGKHFRYDRLHEHVNARNDDDSNEGAWRFAAERLAAGLEDCTDCEACREWNTQPKEPNQ